MLFFDAIQEKILARSLTIILAILCCAAVLRAQDTTGNGEIISVLMAQQNAWNRADIDGYMNGYWHSDSLVFTSGGNIRRGWDSAIASYKKSYDTPEKMGTLTFSGMEIHRLAPNFAWVLGTWELARANDHPKGVFTLLFKKFSDGWKIILDHTSSLKPPPTGKKKQ